MKSNVPIWERGQDGGKTRSINVDALFKNLCEVSQVLTKFGIKHWLSHGTMLGAWRDNNLIPWDDDADIGLDMSDRRKIYPALNVLRAKGFFIPPEGDPAKPISNENMPWYDTVFIRDGEKVEGWWFDRKGDYYIYDEKRCGNDLRHPAKYYETLDSMVFRGVEFPIPNEIENWLLMMYSKDWNVPQKGRKYNNQR
jgi:hypothetical protein